MKAFRPGIYFLLSVLFFPAGGPAAERPDAAAGHSGEVALRQGERIYREGILPSGEPVQAVVKGDIQVEGTMFTCVSCHLRSGIGSFEGGVVTPSTNGKRLYRPRYAGYAGFELTPSEREKLPARYRKSLLRPAYTDETLATALRDGIDPAGRELDPVMPRYLLDDRDMGILISYLKTLSSELSPGVTDTTLHFATVVTEGVSPEDRDAMLVPLETYVRGRTSLAKTYETRVRYGGFSDEMDLSYRKLTLARWELKGPQNTWRGQLEEYHRKEPVFALLGGITTGEWKPIHEFCEEHRIPCLFPMTDFPVVSETDWYTLYFSKGLYQEGEAVARFLGRTEELPSKENVLQVFPDSREGNALSAGFQDTWRSLGHPSPANLTLRKEETITKEFLQRLLEKEKPGILLLWLGPEALPILEAVAASGNRPRRVFVSSSLQKQDLWRLPEKARDFTYITYPYRLPQEEMSLANRMKPGLQRLNVPDNDRRIATRVYTLTRVLSEAFMHMRRNFHREYLLDIIGMLADKAHFPDFERISFGPGQRYASKGCYIVQLTQGSRPGLVKRSDWVTH